jgi:phosphoribosylanthranilate isomerase
MKIKASHITNLTDARYFAARDVQWLSFDFREKSSDYIDPMKARAMFEWVEGPIIVGEFDHMTGDEIRFYTEGWGLKAIQVGMFSDIEVVKSLDGVPVIKEIWIEPFTNSTVLEKTLKAFSPYVDTFQLNFKKGKINWQDLHNAEAILSIEDLEALCQNYKIIVDIDFDTADLAEMKNYPLSGLNLKGGTEERIGVKTFDELDDIFDAMDNEMM